MGGGGRIGFLNLAFATRHRLPWFSIGLGLVHKRSADIMLFCWMGFDECGAIFRIWGAILRYKG